MTTVLGIDLAGSPRRPTGVAIARNDRVRFLTAYLDEEIVNVIVKTKPLIVAIDAPLSMPTRRGMREVDRMMHKLGYPVLPPTFPGMRALTARGMKLFRLLEEAAIRVI